MANKVERYVDAAGRECAYYDSTLLFPKDVPAQNTEQPGVYAVDMSDPTEPTRTASLVTPAMLSPHESLVLNPERGLLAAVLGNPIFYPGVVDIYDVSEDCRTPALLSSTPTGILGHESGFAPDGNTFYAASLSGRTLTAIDVSDPRAPETIWVGDYQSHGLQISDDGRRAYLAARRGAGPDGDRPGLVILDTSAIQDREPNPEPTVVGSVTWPEVSIPQNAIPVTIDGHPYVVEIDEFINGTEGTFSPDALVGAARIIDIADETKPFVVSNIRLEVHDPEVRRDSGALDDPGADLFLQGYAGHYCNVPKREDPGIVACSFILSGLRVFDIRDPHQPREIAYYNAPGEAQPHQMEGAAYAMSSPAFAEERGEIWYSDGNSGFWSLQVTNGVWPFDTAPDDGTADDGAADDGGGGGEPAGQVDAAAPVLPATGGRLPLPAILVLLLGLAAWQGRRARAQA